MSLLSDALRVIRHRPDIAIACMVPWGLMPEVRRWVREQLDEEEAELKLRAVVPPDEIDAALTWVHDCVKRLNDYYDERDLPRITRALVLERYYETYITTGDHPHHE